jgi:hypothetical protein
MLVWMQLAWCCSLARFDLCSLGCFARFEEKDSARFEDELLIIIRMLLARFDSWSLG